MRLRTPILTLVITSVFIGCADVTPEQKPAVLAVVYPNGGERFSRGQSIDVVVESGLGEGIDYAVEWSFDSGASWLPLTVEASIVVEGRVSLPFTFPHFVVVRDFVGGEVVRDTVELSSGRCLVRIEDYQGLGERDICDAPFSVGLP